MGEAVAIGTEAVMVVVIEVIILMGDVPLLGVFADDTNFLAGSVWCHGELSSDSTIHLLPLHHALHSYEKTSTTKYLSKPFVLCDTRTVKPSRIILRMGTKSPRQPKTTY